MKIWYYKGIWKWQSPKEIPFWSCKQQTASCSLLNVTTGACSDGIACVQWVKKLAGVFLFLVELPRPYIHLPPGVWRPNFPATYKRCAKKKTGRDGRGVEPRPQHTKFPGLPLSPELPPGDGITKQKSVPTFSHKKTEKMKNNNKIGTPKESTNGRVYFPIASTSFDDNWECKTGPHWETGNPGAPTCE